MLPALIPLLWPIAEGLIRSIEKALPLPKSGPAKNAGVIQSLQVIVDKLIDTKTPLADSSVVTAQPSVESLAVLVEAVYQRMQVGGKIQEPASNSRQCGVYVLRGSIVEVPE